MVAMGPSLDLRPFTFWDSLIFLLLVPKGLPLVEVLGATCAVQAGYQGLDQKSQRLSEGELGAELVEQVARRSVKNAFHMGDCQNYGPFFGA